MVQPGETLDQIAAANHVAVAKVRWLNGLPPAATLKPGQVLALPKREPITHVTVSSPIHKNGYTFHRDHAERTTLVVGDLAFAKTPVRSTQIQRAAGKPDRRSDDDGGHFIAARSDGPSDAFNHFAQQANFNRGNYRVMEDRWADKLRAGKHVSVTIAVHYPGSSRRPDVIDVNWKVDKGQPRSQRFFNEREGKTHDHR